MKAYALRWPNGAWWCAHGRECPYSWWRAIVLWRNKELW